MNVYYKQKLIFENISKNEIEIKINECLLAEISKYKDLLNRVNSLIDTIKKLDQKTLEKQKMNIEFFWKKNIMKF